MGPSARGTIVTRVGDILTPEAIAAINRPTAEAVCLPNAAYTSEEFLEAERTAMFRERWAFAALGAQVPDRGDTLPVTIAGLPILVLRDQKGAIRAFHNVCRHRGMQLVTEPQKKRPKLVCRYHSWTYELDGRLALTPCFSGPEDSTSPTFDRSRMGIEPVRAEVWNDLVFVNIAGNAPPLAQYLKPLAERWKSYDLSQLRHGFSCQFDLAANWKLAIENFLESYHLPFAHPTLNATSRMEAHLSTVEDLYLGQYSTNYNPGYAGHADLPRFAGLTEKEQRFADYPTLLPNLMFGLHPDYLFLFSVEPLSAERTKETFHFYFIGEDALASDLKPSREKVIELWRKTNLEDMGVVQGMQVGRRSPGYHDGRFSPYHEVTTHEFQRRVANAVANRA
jgi:choline monooxygenase